MKPLDLPMTIPPISAPPRPNFESITSLCCPKLEGGLDGTPGENVELDSDCFGKEIDGLDVPLLLLRLLLLDWRVVTPVAEGNDGFPFMFVFELVGAPVPLVPFMLNGGELTFTGPFLSVDDDDHDGGVFPNNDIGSNERWM